MLKRETPLLLLAALAAALGGTPRAAQGGVLKGPYLVDMDRASVRVRFETDTLLESDVRIEMEGGASASAIFPARAEPFRVKVAVVSAESAKRSIERQEERFLFEARLQGLLPDTAYRYRVFHGDEAAGEGRFRTFGRADRAAFIALGDVRTGHEFHRALVAQFPRHRPDFITIAGDLVGDGRVHAQWQHFFDIEGQVLCDVPLFPSWGNHEGRGGYFERYFPFPDHARGRFFLFYRRLFYDSFDCGPVHVVLVDSGAEPDGWDLEWLERDLTAARDQPWKIAVYHHPSFNEGGHGSSFGVAKLLPLFRKHGLDLTITGHSHLYERTFPLKRQGDDQKPIVHVVAGGGGAPLYDDRDAFFIAQHRKAHCFLSVEAEPEELVGTAYGLDGVPFDRFVLRKPSAAGRAGAPVQGFSPTGEPPAAEENVVLWRAVRSRLDTGLRFRIPAAVAAPPVGKPEGTRTETGAGKTPALAAPLPAPLPWLLDLPPAPLEARCPLAIEISPRDLGRWRIEPERARIEWSARGGSCLFRIAPQTAEVLIRKEPPRLSIRFESPYGEFRQEAVLKATFSPEGETTRRDRL